MTDEPVSRNIINQVKPMPRAERDRLLGARGGVLWFTGLSGSGKSTIARALERMLVEKGRVAYVLDGDEIRAGLNRDLGFSAEDRRENLRRIAEVARLFAESGAVCITAFISPLQEHRDSARAIIGEDLFTEVYIETSIETCEIRDPKGHYKKARAGEIKNFTGVDAPFEVPKNPGLVLKTENRSPSDAAADALSFLTERSMIGA